MDLSQAVLAAIALMIALAGLLAISPSRKLGIGAAVVAVATGLSVAVLSAGRTGRPAAGAQWPKISTAQPLAIGQFRTGADERALLDQELAKAEVGRLARSEERLLAQVAALAKEVEQANTAGKAGVEVAAGAQRKTEARLRTETAERQRLEAAHKDLVEALKKAESSISVEQAAHAGTRAELAKLSSGEKMTVTEPAAAPTAVPVTSVPVPAVSVPVPAASSAPAAAVAVSAPKIEQTSNAGASELTRDQLEAGITAPSFALRPMPDRELVAGRTGSYYSITLNNPATGKPVTFEKERYVLAGRDADFLAAAAALRGQLADALPAGVARTLYVRGFASNAAFTQSRAVADSRAALKKVSYLAAVPGRAGQYKGPPSQQNLDGPYQASHLPLLRAANVRELLAREIKGPEIEIISGASKPETDPQANAFEIILYAVWP